MNWAPAWEGTRFLKHRPVYPISVVFPASSIIGVHVTISDKISFWLNKCTFHVVVQNLILYKSAQSSVEFHQIWHKHFCMPCGRFPLKTLHLVLPGENYSPFTLPPEKNCRVNFFIRKLGLKNHVSCTKLNKNWLVNWASLSYTDNLLTRSVKIIVKK